MNINTNNILYESTSIYYLVLSGYSNYLRSRPLDEIFPVYVTIANVLTEVYITLSTIVPAYSYDSIELIDSSLNAFFSTGKDSPVKVASFMETEPLIIIQSQVNFVLSSNYTTSPGTN